MGIGKEIEREYGVVLHDQDHIIMAWAWGQTWLGQSVNAKNTGLMNVEEHELSKRT